MGTVEGSSKVGTPMPPAGFRNLYSSDANGAMDMLHDSPS